MYPAFFGELFELVEPLSTHVKRTHKVVGGVKHVHIASPKKTATIPAFHHDDDVNVTTFDEVLCRVGNHLVNSSLPHHLLATRTEGLVPIHGFYDATQWQALLDVIGAPAIIDMLLHHVVLLRTSNDQFLQIAGQPVHQLRIPKNRAAAAPQIETLARKRPQRDAMSFPTALIEPMNRKQQKRASVATVVDTMKESDESPRKRKRNRSHQQRKRARKAADARISKENTEINKKTVPGVPVNSSNSLRRYLLYYANPQRESACPTFVYTTKHIFGTSQVRHRDAAQVRLLLLQRMFPYELRVPGRESPRVERAYFLADHVLAHHPLHSLLPMLNRHCPKPSPRADDGKSPTMASFATAHHDVYWLTRAFLKNTLPFAALGSEHNWRVLFHGVARWIGMRRRETLRPCDIIHGLRVNDCQWLNDQQKTRHVPPSDLAKRTQVLVQFIAWLFEMYITDFLRTCFYVTEHSSHRNDIFYFRHDVWREVSKAHFSSALDASYTAIEESFLHTLSLGTAKLRLLPKTTDIRLISNMKCTKKINTKGRFYDFKTNDHLQSALLVLKMESLRQGLFGSGVTNMKQAVLEINAYKARLARRHGSLPSKLYFCKVDVANCFNTITQGKLMQFLANILVEDEYRLQDYKYIRQTTNRARAVRAQLARGEKHRASTTLDQIKAHLPARAIVVPSRGERTLSREYLLQLLEEHITRNTIKHNSHYYRQVTGIPQGSVLSMVLCNLFYGNLEKEQLAYLQDDKDGILLRYVDDIVYISADLQFVRRFEQDMAHGFADYGAMINVAKKMTNLDSPSIDLPWCGTIISMQNLDVYKDYSSYTPQDMASALTVTLQKPGNALLTTCIKTIKMGMQWLRPSTNTSAATLVNIYNTARMCGVKLRQHSAEMARHSRHPGNERFLLKLVRQSLICFMSFIPPSLPHPQVVWLILHGFYTAFAPRRGKYARLTWTLLQHLERLPRTAQRAMYRQIAKWKKQGRLYHA